MTRVKNIKNRKMTREEQIPIIKQFEAHSLLMMSSLDVAMTKIRELEEENMELKMSVKEAETKISLLEREKRRANRRTVIIADSHRKALDFDRLADFLGDCLAPSLRQYHLQFQTLRRSVGSGKKNDRGVHRSGRRSGH